MSSEEDYYYNKCNRHEAQAQQAQAQQAQAQQAQAQQAQAQQAQAQQAQAQQHSFGEALKKAIGGMARSNRSDNATTENIPYRECKIEHQDFQKCLKENPNLCYDFYCKLTECILYKTDINMCQ